MQRTILALAISGALVFTSATTVAMQRGQGGPKVKPARATQTPQVQAPKVKAGGGGPKIKTASAPKVQGPKSHGPKATAAKAPKTKTPKASRPAAAKRTEKTTTRSTTTTTTTTAATGGTSTGSVALTPVQQKLQRNTNLASKLSGRLPAGTDLMTAAAGFRNLGQFVAAVNVSNNLGIPFAQLKTSMVDNGLSLGQSIQALRPTADSRYQASRATSDADALIRATSVTTATTTSSTTTTKTKANRPAVKTKATVKRR